MKERSVRTAKPGQGGAVGGTGADVPGQCGSWRGECGNVGLGTWELCSLPSAPRPHHPGHCVYQVDFFGTYLWQSIALFCQGHGARLFPRFTVFKKREKPHTSFARPSATLLATVPLAPGPWALLLRARLCPAASQHLPVQASLAAHVDSPPLPPPFTTPLLCFLGLFWEKAWLCISRRDMAGGN